MLAWLSSNPLPPGTPAPDFSLPDEKGRIVSLSQLRGKNVVLVFYPSDDTTICRKQLCELRDRWHVAQEKNLVVLGVNPQSPQSHAKFQEKSKLPFPLLVDRGQKIGALYKTKGLMVKRTVYLIGPDGVIRYSKRGKPGVDEVFAAAAVDDNSTESVR